MQKHSEFTPIHTILIPFVHEGPGLHALEARGISMRRSFWWAWWLCRPINR